MRAERLSGARRRHEVREIELAALDEELARTRDTLATAERDATEERATLPARRAAVAEAREAREQAELAMRRERAELADVTTKVTTAELEFRTAEERALAARCGPKRPSRASPMRTLLSAGLEDLRADLARRRRRAEQVARAARSPQPERASGHVSPRSVPVEPDRRPTTVISASSR